MAADLLRIKAESDRILANLDDWADAHMLRLGVAPRELAARLNLVPKAIKKALPKESIKEFLAGLQPRRGWGIGGVTGGGKTMAQSAMLREHLQAIAKREAPLVGNFQLSRNNRTWCSWPEEVNWLRSHALDPVAQERIDHLQSCGLLFLDDLGRERIKGSYAEDWAASQLDSILNTRYRHERPVIWTTNLTATQLAAIYGGAMLSRLIADNPLVWIDGLVDLRGRPIVAHSPLAGPSGQVIPLDGKKALSGAVPS